MKIKFLGLSCFLLKTLGEKRKEIKILVDPFFENFKEKPSLGRVDILILGQNKAPCEIKGSPFLIQGPGEYEVKSVFIQGIGVGENTAYLVESEGTTICHLNSLAKRELNSDFLEKVGNVDVLLVPVGKDLGPEGAVDVISQIEPKLAIPMEYEIPNSKLKRRKLSDFLGVLGIEKPEIRKELNTKKLPQEIEVLILKPK